MGTLCKFSNVCIVIISFTLCNGFPVNLEKTFTDTHTQLLTGLVAVLLTICSIVLLAGCLCCQRRNGFKEFQNSPTIATTTANPDSGHVNPISNGEFIIFTPLSPSPHQNNNVFITNEQATAGNIEEYSFGDVDVSSWFDENPKEFPRTRLKYIRELGKGWFGSVVEGAAQDLNDEQSWTPVAVRILESTASNKERAFFLHDADIYRCEEHSNILKLYGKCLDTIPFLILQEYCSQGDLKSYLCANRTISHKLLFSEYPLIWCCQLTSALKHLHENNFIHPDLAVRNCQLTANLTLKCGDYGLAPSKYPKDYYEGSPGIPVRWCAPESITHTHTTIQPKKISKEANIWSLGVCFWEICECGEQPYSTLSDDEVVTQVLGCSNVRLSRPSIQTIYIDFMYRLMQLCWTTPESRPSMMQIHLMMSDLLQVFKNTESTNTEAYFSIESFDDRWNLLKPNTVVKTDNHIIEMSGIEGELNEEILNSKPLSPSLNNLHGSLDNLTVDGCQIENDDWSLTSRNQIHNISSMSLQDTPEDFDTSISSRDVNPLLNKKTNQKIEFKLGPFGKHPDELNQTDSLNDSINWALRSSGSDTEEENWKIKVERGAYSEKVREKSKSVTDLMVLTHIDCSESESETPLPSLDHRINYKNVRYATKQNLESGCYLHGSEGNLLSVQDTFQAELKKLQLEHKDSLLFVPDMCSQNVNIDNQVVIKNLDNLCGESVEELATKRLLQELNNSGDLKPPQQVFNIFNVTINKPNSFHFAKMNKIINLEDLESKPNEVEAISTFEVPKLCEIIQNNSNLFEVTRVCVENSSNKERSNEDNSLFFKEENRLDEINISKTTEFLNMAAKVDEFLNQEVNNSFVIEKDKSGIDGKTQNIVLDGVFECEAMKNGSEQFIRTDNCSMDKSKLSYEVNTTGNATESRIDVGVNRNILPALKSEEQVGVIGVDNSLVSDVKKINICDSQLDSLKEEKVKSLTKPQEKHEDALNYFSMQDGNNQDAHSNSIEGTKNHRNENKNTFNDVSITQLFKVPRLVEIIENNDVLMDYIISNYESEISEGLASANINEERGVDSTDVSINGDKLIHASQESIDCDHPDIETTDLILKDSNEAVTQDIEEFQDYNRSEIETDNIVLKISNQRILNDNEDLIGYEDPDIKLSNPILSDLNLDAKLDYKEFNDSIHMGILVDSKNGPDTETNSSLFVGSDQNEMHDDVKSNDYFHPQANKTKTVLNDSNREAHDEEEETFVEHPDIESNNPIFEDLNQMKIIDDKEHFDYIHHGTEITNTISDDSNQQEVYDDDNIPHIESFPSVHFDLSHNQAVTMPNPLTHLNIFNSSGGIKSLQEVITSTPNKRKFSSLNYFPEDPTESELESVSTNIDLKYSLDTWDNFLGKSFDRNTTEPNNIFDSFTSEGESTLFLENNGESPDVGYDRNETYKVEDVDHSKTFIVEELPASEKSVRNVSANLNKTFTAEPADSTFVVDPENCSLEDGDSNGSWEAGGGWFLHSQSNNEDVTGDIVNIANSPSYVGFSMDDEVMAAIRNELIIKLPHARGPANEKIKDDEEWETTDRNEVFLRYNVYNNCLSPIPEESFSEDISSPSSGGEEEDDDDQDSDWSEKEIIPHELESQSLPALECPENQVKEFRQLHTPSLDSCCSNDTLFNLEDLTCVATDLDKEMDSQMHELLIDHKDGISDIKSSDQLDKWEESVDKSVVTNTICCNDSPNLNHTNERNQILKTKDSKLGDEAAIENDEMCREELPASRNGPLDSHFGTVQHLQQFLDKEKNHCSSLIAISEISDKSYNLLPFINKHVAPLPSPEDKPWKQLPASQLTYDKVFPQSTIAFPQNGHSNFTKNITEDATTESQSDDISVGSDNLDEVSEANETLTSEREDIIFETENDEDDIYNEADYVNITNLENCKISAEFNKRDLDEGSKSIEFMENDEVIISDGIEENEDMFEVLTDIRYNGLADSQLMSTSFSESNELDLNDEQDWDSGSDTRSSSSGEFIWKEGEHEESLKALRAAPQDMVEDAKSMEGVDEETFSENSCSEEDEECPEFVPSAWDKFAKPSKSALRSPEKTLENQPKNPRGVWFKKQRYHCVYEYPREPESPVLQSFDLWNNKPIFNSYSGMQDEFFISSSATPFDMIRGMNSQFFPGGQEWLDVGKTCDNTTPDSGVEDITPSSLLDNTDFMNLDIQEMSVPSLKHLSNAALCKLKQKEAKINEALGGLRHTRDKLKLDLPPSPTAFTSTRTFNIETVPEPVLIREKPTFTTFGKSRFLVQHVDTPEDDTTNNKNVCFEALPYKPIEKQMIKEDLESVKTKLSVERGEASLLDSADEDSGIESSTLERKLCSTPGIIINL